MMSKIPNISKKLIGLALFIVLSLIVAGNIKKPFSQAGSCANLDPYFTDTNFHSCVLSEMQNSINPNITYIDGCNTAFVTDLNCSNKNIAKINGAQYLTALTVLDLNSNSIKNINPLNNSSSLTDLNLSNNNILSIDTLSNSPNLVNLDLSNNNIVRIDALSGLTKLVTLYLNDNKIAHLNPLNTLSTTITELKLQNNNIINPASVYKFTNLTSLDLSGNKIGDLSSLTSIAGFASGNNIDISDNEWLSGYGSANALTDVATLEANGATVTHNITSSCYTCGPTCGNDYREQGEQCDDGNTSDGDGCSSTCQTEGNIYYVDYDTGSGSACTEASPCLSIGWAFENCTNLINDIKGTEYVSIYVKGTRSSNDVITNGSVDTSPAITIQRWEGDNTPVIDGGRLDISNISTTVIIDGFEIKNDTGIHVSSTDNLILKNNHIHSNTGGNIVADVTNGLIIENNYIHDNANGITGVITSGNFTLKDNYIYEDGQRITADTSAGSSSFENNFIYNSNYGINGSASNYFTYTDNIIYAGSDVNGSADNFLYTNNIIDNISSGRSINSNIGDDITLTDNAFYSGAEIVNGGGSTDDITATNNVFYAEGNVSNDSDGNISYNGNFIDTISAMVFNSNSGNVSITDTDSHSASEITFNTSNGFISLSNTNNYAVNDVNIVGRNGITIGNSYFKSTTGRIVFNSNSGNISITDTNNYADNDINIDGINGVIIGNSYFESTTGSMNFNSNSGNISITDTNSHSADSIVFYTSSGFLSLSNANNYAVNDVNIVGRNGITIGNSYFESTIGSMNFNSNSGNMNITDTNSHSAGNLVFNTSAGSISLSNANNYAVNDVNIVGRNGITIGNSYFESTTGSMNFYSNSGNISITDTNSHSANRISFDAANELLLTGNTITAIAMIIANDNGGGSTINNNDVSPGSGFYIIHNNLEINGNHVYDGTDLGLSINGNGSLLMRDNFIHNNAGFGASISNNNNPMSFYNNIISNNTNGVDECGVRIESSSDPKIINNSFYNNCDFVDTIADLALFNSTNSIVKQNLVYDSLGGHTYYFDVGGADINGVPINTEFDQTALNLIGGNNFIATTNPFANVAGATNWATASSGYLLSSSEYKNYQIVNSLLDTNTPTEDFVGYIRPTGTMCEMGAMENRVYSKPPVDSPVCTPIPTKLDIRNTMITQQDGKTSVTLKWGKSGLMDINPNQKVEIFFDYLKKSPPAKIGSNNIRLQNVFAYYVYGEVSGSLKDVFDAELGDIKSDVCDNDTAEDILDVIESMKSDSEMNSLITDFINNLLSLENTIIESSKDANMYFTNYYYGLFSGGGSAGTVKVIRKVNKGGIFIPDGITEINSDATSWTDTNIPISDAVKLYKYQIVTDNCGETKYGNEAEVVIDPIIPAGTDVEVVLDLKIKVKDAYDNLLMNKFRKLFIEENYEFDYKRTCDEIKDKLFETANGEYALEYLITCFGEEDEVLMRGIAEREIYIVPPLIRLVTGGLAQSEVNSRIKHIINGIKAKIELYENAQGYAQDEQLPVGDFVNELDVDNLNTAQKEIMKLLGKEYFEGISHSANIEIEKYDASGNLLETFNTSTDIFGDVTIRIGKFVSGDDYTLKIKLTDERFVLPKVATLQINNAVKKVRPFGIVYTADIDLEFDRSFRYGDFNEDGEINLSDIGEWGKLLKGEVAGDYQLWELWEFANLDGLEGIDLLDVVTLQENWGGVKDFQIEDSEMTLREILELFGIYITSDPTLDAMIKVSGWLDMVGVEC